MLCNDIKMFSEEKLSRTGQRTTKYWYKIFLFNLSYSFEYQKGYINELSIKMFLKRQSRKDLRLSNASEFQTSVTFLVKAFLTSCRKTVSVVKLSLGITRFFGGHCLIFGANIQAWDLSSSTELVLKLFLPKVETTILEIC